MKNENISVMKAAYERKSVKNQQANINGNGVIKCGMVMANENGGVKTVA
jgi:hypothetical protein